MGIKSKMLDLSTRGAFSRRDGSTVFVNQLSSVAAFKSVFKDVIGLKLRGVRDITLDFSAMRDGSYFPNVLVPLSVFLLQLKRENPDLEINIANLPKALDHTNFLAPQHSGRTSQYPSVLNKVWRFEAPEDVFKLVTEYMDAIYKADVFEADNMLTWIEWCLNEVMDNVIQHSEASEGFVMAQVHPNSKHIAFCIADSGRGILNSLLTSSEYWPKDAADAITLALKEGVTRDKNVGQGNGLWGLHEVVRKSSGQLTLSSSGTSLVTQSAGRINAIQYVNLNHKLGGGTVVDFQLDYSVPISLKEVLGGYQPESVKIFSSTDNEVGNVHFKLIDQKSGFGTRKSGERIRNEIINLIHESHTTIEIDFEGVGIVSSSFADELIGKTFVDLGPLRFSQVVKLTNMNDTIDAIVNKAVSQRYAQSLKTT